MTIERILRVKAIRLWYSLAMIFLTVIVMGITSVVYTNQVARENEAKWCGIVVTLDEANDSVPPPTTEYGKRLAADIERLRSDLNCKDNAGDEVKQNG